MNKWSVDWPGSKIDPIDWNALAQQQAIPEGLLYADGYVRSLGIDPEEYRERLRRAVLDDPRYQQGALSLVRYGFAVQRWQKPTAPDFPEISAVGCGDLQPPIEDDILDDFDGWDDW